MIATLVVIVGFVLRFLMLISEKSLWGDEWFSIGMAQQSLVEVFASVTYDVHPPFFYAALHLLVKWLGFHEWVFRLIPFSAGVGTVFLVYALGQKITGDRKSALLAAFLVAISPYWLHISNEIRSYSLLGFLSCLATLLFLRLMEGQRTRREKFLYILTAISVPYLEHIGWFWLFGVVVYTGYLYVSGRLTDRSLLWLHVGIIILCLPSLGIVIYQALYTEPVLHASRLSPYYSLIPMLKKITGVFWHFACGPHFSMLSAERVFHYILKSPSFWFFFLVTLVLFMLCIKSIRSLGRKPKSIHILLILLLFFPILCLAILYPIRLNARYLTFAAPYFFILVGNGLAKELRKSWAVIMVVILAVSYLYTDYNFIKMKTDPVHREDYPALIRYTFENAGADDVICGFLLGPQVVPYYEPRLKVHRSAVNVYSCFELSEDVSLAKFTKIWLMGYMDMDEKTNRRNLAYFERHFGNAGFISMKHVKRFGGENGLTSVYVFEK